MRYLKAAFRGALVGSWLALAFDAYAQTCIIPAPATPPQPSEFICRLPLDGGSQGCLCRATVPGGAQPQDFLIGNAKCATAVAIAKQAAAIDNGWNDGGVP